MIIMAGDLTLVKLGGSLITNKLRPYTVRQEVLNRMAREIKQSGTDKLIVGHGSGSFGHQTAYRYQTQRGIINQESYRGISLVHNDAARLNTIVVNTFLKHGINAISVQPSACTICRRGRIARWDTEPVKNMLKMKQLPVPYGDVGFDEKKGCCITSTEEVLSFLARKLKARRMIIVGKVDGVIASGSGKEKPSLVKRISNRNFPRIRRYLYGSDGVDVTGGMLQKVESMISLAKNGITSEIINGEKPGNLLRALRGEKGIGTVIR